MRAFSCVSLRLFFLESLVLEHEHVQPLGIASRRELDIMSFETHIWIAGLTLSRLDRTHDVAADAPAAEHPEEPLLAEFVPDAWLVAVSNDERRGNGLTTVRLASRHVHMPHLGVLEPDGPVASAREHAEE